MLSVESLQSLRIGLRITSLSTTLTIIAFMGSLSNIGKSFIALNLAQVIANSGKRTLLIDADVRKGSLHQTLLQPKNNGFSEYLENNFSYENLIRPIHDNLFLSPVACLLNIQLNYSKTSVLRN